MKSNIYVYCFILILIATLAVVWFLYRQQLQQFEYFTSSPNDCVIYYTNNKKACDDGYYLMSDSEFNVYFNNSKTRRDYNLDAVKKERDGTIGRICKLKYNGWNVDPSMQPIENPADKAVINARGNVNTWMMCRRNIKPKPDPTIPNQLYSVAETQKEYEKYQTLFGTYRNVSIEKTPFTPISTNIDKPLTQANPEYIHMYFTSSSTQNRDLNSVCNNPTVDYTPDLLQLNSPQYGIELGILNQKIKDKENYFINKLNLIKTLSREDYSHFVYENAWQDPNIDKLIELFYRFSTNVNNKTITYTAQNIQMDIYKLLLDECNKLVNLNNKAVKIARVINFGSLFNLNKYDIITAYPYNIRLRNDTRYKSIYNLSYITSYNEATIQLLTDALEEYIQILETDYTNRYNIVVGITNNFIAQNGYCYETYDVPSIMKTTVEAAAKTDTIFTNDTIKQEIFNNERSKKEYRSIYNYYGLYITALNNQFTFVKTHLSIPSGVVAGTPYNFQLHIYGHDINFKPAHFYVEALYNDTIVGSYYYCNAIDTCNAEKDALLQQYAREKGTSSLEYINLLKSIKANECFKNNCTINSPFILQFPLTLNTDINLNRLEIRVYSNYPANNKTKQLTISLYYNFNNRWLIYPRYKYHYNIEDYHPTYQAIFEDKKNYYYPAKDRIQQNNDLITAFNNGTASFKNELKQKISNIYVDAFNLLNINKNNTSEFVSRYLSGNERIYMFFSSPKTYIPIATDNRSAIDDFNKYITVK